MSEPSNDGEMKLTLERIGIIRHKYKTADGCFATDAEMLELLDLAEAALQHPRTQQPRITREQLCSAFLKPVFLDMGYKGEPNESDISRMAFRLRELGIEVVPDPPEVHE